MEPVEMTTNGGKEEISAEPISFARSYQVEAWEKAMKQNTIVFLETGSGKTLIAIMLLRSYAHLFRKPSPFISIFLVPNVVLVKQQAEAIKMRTDLKVGMYWGEMGVDFWQAPKWKSEQDEYEVLVMTPAVLLNALRHSFLKLDMIKVLIFDECHNARGRHPYACIMTEFYHPKLLAKNTQLPRIFGMTASPIKAKGKGSAENYWKEISQLENIYNSKVYTTANESVLAEHITFATPKLKMYNALDIPYDYFKIVENELERIRIQCECSLENPNISNSIAESAKKKLNYIFSNVVYCMNELGILLAFKAAESLKSAQHDTYANGKSNALSENASRRFCLDASMIFTTEILSDEHKTNAKYLSSKVICLFDCLHEYREIKDLRCIIFVDRIITAVVLRSLLNEILSESGEWKTEYLAGSSTSKLVGQTKKEQNKIIDEFRQGNVNIIVSTSILEEGLDVQSCNLVIRFDPSDTICSFIQSRGRARKQNSDFIIMMKSSDELTRTQVENHLGSGEMMRKESLSHALDPCAPMEIDETLSYQVEATGAIVTMNSSVQLLHFYCSRLPSDGYFKANPRFVIDKELKVCTLHLPKDCPVSTVQVEGELRILKQLACFEACKQLHLVRALTDNLVPDIFEEELNDQESKFEYNNEQVQYSPSELISKHRDEAKNKFYCYVLELHQNYHGNTQLHDVLLCATSKFDFCEAPESLSFDLAASIRYVGVMNLTSEQVSLSRRFQVTLLNILLNHKVNEAACAFDHKTGSAVFDYLLFPATFTKNPLVDWKTVRSVLLQSKPKQCICDRLKERVLTKSGLVCQCIVNNSLVCTPHNDYMYYVSGTIDGLCGNSDLKLRGGEVTSYKKYYERHGVHLQHEGQTLLHGKRIANVQNYLLKNQTLKTKESSDGSVELPPELCLIIMAPISLATIYSFSLVPSIIHRIESLLLAAKVKKMHLEFCPENVKIPTFKVLEAITTKKCQEKFHLESLETLGDSFLKYASSLQLFQTYQNNHEGLLSIKRARIISNNALCKLGCDCKIPGFIRNEPFDIKKWIIPGDSSVVYALEEVDLVSPTTKVYVTGTTRKIKSKTVADVVEALIGVYLTEGGEFAAFSFMHWLGIKVNIDNIPYTRGFFVHPEAHVDLSSLELLLNYSFRDASYLVEALTHGSSILPDIPRCYQRLEFLGDSVLDYLITLYLYKKYPGLTPGQLTDLRSASVNNDCYAQSAIKAGLNKHILHNSHELQRQLTQAISKHSSVSSTFGWGSKTNLPKVLGDVMESLAGAILVDSNYDKELVFRCIRPLLEPLVTPESMKLHPVRELSELCQKEGYLLKKPIVTRENGKASVMVEVEANGVPYRFSNSTSDKKTSKRLAFEGMLKLLKENDLSNVMRKKKLRTCDL